MRRVRFGEIAVFSFSVFYLTLAFGLLRRDLPIVIISAFLLVVAQWWALLLDTNSYTNRSFLAKAVVYILTTAPACHMAIRLISVFGVLSFRQKSIDPDLIWATSIVAVMLFLAASISTVLRQNLRVKIPDLVSSKNSTVFRRQHEILKLGGTSVIFAEIGVYVALFADRMDIANPISAFLLLAFLFVFVIAAQLYSLGQIFRIKTTIVDKISAQIASKKFEILVYFSAGNPTSCYQLLQWIPYIKKLNRPTMVVVREFTIFKSLQESTDLPIYFAPSLAHLDSCIQGDTTKLVFYVNNGVKNAHMTRYEQVKHVQLLHGESDKKSSSNRLSAIYDQLFVSGQAAIDRYKVDGNLTIPKTKFRIIGRPQTDQIEKLSHPNKEADPKAPKTWLYAPTWEGYFGDVNYSSLGRGGLQLLENVQRLFPQDNIIFKPHPLSGTTCPTARQALIETSKFIRLLSAKNGNTNQYQVIFPEMDCSLIDLINSSSFLISDVSGLLCDYLVSGKPTLAIDIEGIGAPNLYRKYPSLEGTFIIDKNAINFEQIGLALRSGDPLFETRRKTAEYIFYSVDFPHFPAFEKEANNILSAQEIPLK